MLSRVDSFAILVLIVSGCTHVPNTGGWPKTAAETRAYYGGLAPGRTDQRADDCSLIQNRFSNSSCAAEWDRAHPELGQVVTKPGDKEQTSAPTPKPFRPTMPLAKRLQIYETAVARSLRDPDSARFDAVRIIAEDRASAIICGFLNAKNGFGAYIGSQPFYAELFVEGDKAAAVPFLAQRVGLRTVLAKCGDDGGGK